VLRYGTLEAGLRGPPAHPRQDLVTEARRLRGARGQWRRPLRLPGLHHGTRCRRAAPCSAIATSLEMTPSASKAGW